MTDLSDLPFAYPSEATPTGATGQRCRHPKAARLGVSFRENPRHRMSVVGELPDATCALCGHDFYPAARRRGRTSNRAGKDAERLVERLTGLAKVGEYGSPVDVGNAASWAIGQVKAGHRYSTVDEADLDRMASEAHGRPRLLFKVKRPGPGHARRVTVTLRLSDLIAEHGDALVTLDMPDWKELHVGTVEP